MTLFRKASDLLAQGNKLHGGQAEVEARSDPSCKAMWEVGTQGQNAFFGLVRRFWLPEQIPNKKGGMALAFVRGEMWVEVEVGGGGTGYIL